MDLLLFLVSFAITLRYFSQQQEKSPCLSHKIEEAALVYELLWVRSTKLLHP